MKRFKNKDWCSYFPDHVFGKYIGDVCAKHDVRYEDKSKSRWTSDLELFNDVKRRGLPITAGVMWIGVRLIGWKFYNKAGK